jgi:hypothetical protein
LLTEGVGGIADIVELEMVEFFGWVECELSVNVMEASGESGLYAHRQGTRKLYM